MISLLSIGTALPSLEIRQPEALDFLLRRHPPAGASLALHRRIFRHPSVETRRFAVRGLEDLRLETVDQTSVRFQKQAAALAGRALNRALRAAGVRARNLDFLAATTCTGYLCPGLSSYVAESAGLRSDASLRDLTGMGCAAALPALESARDFAAAHPGSVAAVVCVELGSAAFFPGDAPDLIVSNALFGDGAAAVLVSAGPRKRGVRLVKSAALHVPAWREEIRFRTEDGKLRNVLSPAVPRRAAEGLGRLLKGLLGRRSPADIPHWGLHPGGAKVLEALRDELGLPEETLAPARRVLRRLGNMSSPSCLFVLDDILRRGKPKPGEAGVLASFGAGFSAYAALLEF